MRTFLTDIKQGEAYLQGQLAPQEHLLFEARLLASPLLRLNLKWQKKVYALLQLYHRRKLKEEAEAVHQALFKDPSRQEWQQQIHQLFNPQQP